MKYTVKNLIASVMAMTCMATMQGNVVLAQQETPYAENNVAEVDMDACTIYKQCGSELVSLTAKAASTEEKRDVLYHTCELLEDAGVQSYVVESGNYEVIQEQLGVDFQDLGLRPEYTYLVIDGDMGADHKGIQPYSSESSAFSYTYNGKTYSLKYLTITAADDPAYEKADDADLLTSSSQELINNCLNTAIITYISSVSYAMGTVASICGLDISDFASGHSATLRLNGGANWNRVFTLVYSSADGGWMRGSSVEWVDTYSYMSGIYYDASTNRMESVERNEKRATRYSEYFSDYDWRKRNAVIYVINANGCNYDEVGSVSFYYGNSKKITLREDF